MLRYVCLLFVVNAIAFAQPARLWKRDGHIAQAKMLGFDKSHRFVYTHSRRTIQGEGITDWLYKWDVDGDTVVQRIQLPGVAKAIVDDSTILVERNYPSYVLVRIIDGSVRLEAPLYMPIDWIDPTSSIAVGWLGYGDTTSIMLIDLKTLTVIAKGLWGSGRKYIGAYDTKNKILYGGDRDGYFGMNMALEKTRLTISGRPNEGLNDIEVVDDGTLLISLSVYNDSTNRVIAIDPLTSIQFDSVVVPGPLYANSARRVIISAPDNRIVLNPGSGVLTVLMRNPLRIEGTISTSHIFDPIIVHNADSVYVGTTKCAITLFNPRTLVSEEILPQRHVVLSGTQLHDGRLAISQLYLDPQIISVKDGNDVQPLWTYQPWVSQHGDKFTIIAASNAPVVAIANARMCRLIQTNDTTTLCTIRAEGDIITGSIGAFETAWINSLGTQAAIQFVSTPSIRISYHRYLGCYRSEQPCSDYLLPLITRTNSGASVSSIEENSYNTMQINKLLISASGESIMISITDRDSKDTARQTSDTNDVYLYSPFNQLRRSFQAATIGLFLTGDTRIVVDDSSGLAFADVDDTLSYNVVNLGLRHLPLAVMHGTQRVITYTDKTLQCVDVDNGTVLWSMPVASQPTNILVDRTDRWFLCTYADDYVEMFALDTTVSVSEAINTRNELVVSPNPANETLSLRAPFPISEYALYDVLGNMVMSASVESATTMHSVNIESLPSGTYVLSVTAMMRRATAIVQKRGQ